MARKPAADTREDDEPDELAPSGLEIFDDAEDTLTWYFYRLAETGQREDARHGYVMKVVGRVDPEDLRRELGGGLYRAIGRQGRELLHTKRVRIAGPPRQDAAAPSVPAAGGAAPPLSAADARLDRIEAALASMTATRAPTFLEMAQIFSNMNGGGNAAALVPAMLGMFEKGAALAGAAGKGSETADIIREAVAGAAMFLGKGSSTAATLQPGPGDATDDFVRLLVRARASGRSPEEAADGADAVLSDLDLAKLRSSPTDAVLSVIRARCPFSGQELANFEAYVAAFLAAMRESQTGGEGD